MKTLNRILLNSVALYVKTGITVFVTIFYARYLLIALGVDDYGIYSLVGGIIGLLGFVTASVTNSATRYLANAIGKDDTEETRSVFLSVLFVTRRIILFLILVLELLGIVFINWILDIPEDRIIAANIIYQLMVITVAYNLMTAPYRSLLYSREKILKLSIIEVSDVILRLGIAYSLTYSRADNLILYSVLICALSFGIRSVLKQVCKRSEEVARTPRVKGNPDVAMTRSLVSFSTWNLLEQFGYIAVTQGSVFLVNVFFGVAVNAALGIANVVRIQLSNFTNSFLQAVQPQIFISYGEQDKVKQDVLFYAASKMGIILLALVVVPLVSEIDYILGIWLKEVPEFTAILIKLSLLWALVNQFSWGLIISIRAHGRIRELQIITFTLLILNLPLTYYLFRTGAEVHVLYFVSIGIEGVILACRTYLAKKLIGLNVMQFLFRIILVPAAVISGTFMLVRVLQGAMEASAGRLALVILVSVVSIGTLSMFLVLSRKERQRIREARTDIMQRIRNT